MPKKPDIQELAKDWFDDQGPGKPHPLRSILKDENSGRILMIPIDALEANPHQPRKTFDEESLADLTASVREVGILQPILVYKKPGTDTCVIIAGERRWRAAKAAGLTEIPATVRPPQNARELALIENVQRQNLNPIEEAEALLALKTERGYTDQQLAQVIGKSRKAVNETLLLNQLPEAIKAEWRTSATGSKSQLLQVLRAGSPEKLQATWDAVQRGELRTVRDLRKAKKHAGGRPQHVRLEYAPAGKLGRVIVTFAKKSTTRAELRALLKAALKDLPKQLHA
jgi:ParB family chromosome partitioning protein